MNFTGMISTFFNPVVHVAGGFAVQPVFVRNPETAKIASIFSRIGIRRLRMNLAITKQTLCHERFNRNCDSGRFSAPAFGNGLTSAHFAKAENVKAKKVGGCGLFNPLPKVSRLV
jgi:hypothetical protein